MVVQKREASAQRTQADHLRRESLMSSSSREPRVSGKPDAMFSFDSEPTLNTFLRRNRGNELGDQFESSVHSVFRFADPSNVGRSLLEGNKDHLLNQARSELVKQEHQVGSISFSNKLMLKDWNYRTPITDILNLEENNLDYKKNCL